MFFASDFIFILGGKNTSGHSDFWKYDIINKKWTLINLNYLSDNLSLNSCNLFDNYMVIYGGETKSKEGSEYMHLINPMYYFLDLTILSLLT